MLFGEIESFLSELVYCVLWDCDVNVCVWIDDVYVEFVVCVFYGDFFGVGVYVDELIFGKVM